MRNCRHWTVTILERAIFWTPRLHCCFLPSPKQARCPLKAGIRWPSSLPLFIPIRLFHYGSSSILNISNCPFVLFYYLRVFRTNVPLNRTCALSLSLCPKTSFLIWFWVVWSSLVVFFFFPGAVLCVSLGWHFILVLSSWVFMSFISGECPTAWPV